MQGITKGTATGRRMREESKVLSSYGRKRLRITAPRSFLRDLRSRRGPELGIHDLIAYCFDNLGSSNKETNLLRTLRSMESKETL